MLNPVVILKSTKPIIALKRTGQAKCSLLVNHATEPKLTLQMVKPVVVTPGQTEHLPRDIVTYSGRSKAQVDDRAKWQDGPWCWQHQERAAVNGEIFDRRNDC